MQYIVGINCWNKRPQKNNETIVLEKHPEIKNKIIIDETTIEGWHPIKGKWMHIAQIRKGVRIIYYTDGEIEEVKE